MCRCKYQNLLHSLCVSAKILMKGNETNQPKEGGGKKIVHGDDGHKQSLKDANSQKGESKSLKVGEIFLLLVFIDPNYRCNSRPNISIKKLK